ncbi:1-acyl-sn-glycerol-3-phosphate acyltransferase [Gordonia sp. (in: high G+C Gram-positive bacteria)]|uniref:lysophospholipid acyltransferase family protein n=1 Tax=Gordonia sp. (in: high G+C Gram-positive bacteria) TaxID=84139 RepID=UPI0016B49572|nr:lysophospholipid acyltransferase family protein [Gordonia sp. (in: high G+C Gram-positive bacteria)]NLG46815.1 1-acyl-sn-glycerol-3-phosphate acyltransferase [Gordonia sp. (in: high G+C Gram-positive bacteria)]
MEPVYRVLEGLATSILTTQGVRQHRFGLENLPESGGGVIAVNHTSYVDFMPLGLALRERRRRARFLVKSELMDIAIMRYLVKHARAVPVDRTAGGEAYRRAVDALRAGELIAVYPESTISRSFELKEFKSGAVRMAAEAQVPVIPTIIWGSHRQWSKGVVRRMGRHRIPIHIEFGPPLRFPADGDADSEIHQLHDVMDALLRRVQERYDDAPAGADWVPSRLGGGAPTKAEALVIEDAEAAEKAARRAAKNNAEKKRE